MYQSRARPISAGQPALPERQLQEGGDEVRPPLASSRRRGNRSDSSADRIDVVGHQVEHALRRCRPDARQKLQDAKAGHLVARVLHEAQQRQQILDVRGIEELEAAEFDEGDVAAGQLDLERAAVARRPEQHGLLFQLRAALPVLQHPLDHIAGLIRLIAHAHQFRQFGRLAIGPEVLGEALGGQADDAIGGGEDGLAWSGSCGRA